MKITNSVELLDWFKSVADIESDYMVSKLTGIAKQALSHARTGEREFSEHTALKLLLVGEHPEPLNILALMEANKAEKLGKTDLANLWRKSVA
jgi:hypothetical protein